MAKYKQLTDKFINDINSGKLSVGEKMPSLRKLAKQHNISVSTAVRCYEELESQGWLVSRPQSGYFISSGSTNIQTPEWQTFTTQIQSCKRVRKKPRAQPGPLGISRMELDGKSITALDASLRRAARKVQSKLTLYPEAQGELTLRNALASHFSQYGFPLGSEELVITNGCIEAVKSALKACTEPGDTVAISSPCYNGLLELLSELSLNILEIPSLNDGIDLDQLEQHLITGHISAGLFCTTHMNPQGITMSMIQKKRLAYLANHFQIPMIEDDVYLELAHHQNQPLPAAYYDTEGYIIWCGSVSKSLSPSYRLGWVRPGRYFQQYLTHTAEVSTLIQYLVADFIHSGAYTKHLRRSQYQLMLNKRDYISYLSHHLPSGSRITQPEGGLVLWVQIPDFDADLFGRKAFESKLCIRIGTLFTVSDRYRDCVRINIGFSMTHNVKEQLDLLIMLIDQTINANHST
ncbi:aminotransferase-like domain-containing protein [Vibrio salinus]|uniref:aminotransferase-like domain-containing protein n=1 Tax=Vibrio salinus TaxID=2899784 RepID=UPI001E302321|nr:PLP-dependent aminotransferase family protein [Vibrio salinus]MCE0495542.1 PLP-dependent aminotransferase family protein [Vibrio salinus]